MSDAVAMLRKSNPDKSQWDGIWEQAHRDHPECTTELAATYDWLKAGAVSGSLDEATFPYPESGDPHSTVLDPIGWWWNTLYHGLFGGNTLLMFLFGWELFMAPIMFMVALAWTILTLPFRLRTVLRTPETDAGAPQA